MLKQADIKKRARALFFVVAAFGSLGACSGQVDAGLTSGGISQKIRIGYFANVTHAAALVGVQSKLFERYFAADKTKVEFVVFTAGPAVIEAMKGGAIDAGYIGPNPVLMGYATTGGTALRIVAGSTLNGAQLIVQKPIASLSQLVGKTISTPQLANTQDVAARSYLKKQGFPTNIWGNGKIKIVPIDNAATLNLFKERKIAGAWAPEPWASRLVHEGNGKVLLDEKNIWPQKRFITTSLIVGTQFLGRYPQTAETLVKAHVAITEMIQQPNNAVQVKKFVQSGLLQSTGKTLASKTLDRALGNVIFSNDPLAQGLEENITTAQAVGLLRKPSDKFKDIYDLRILNKVLAGANQQTKKYDALDFGVD